MSKFDHKWPRVSEVGYGGKLNEVPVVCPLVLYKLSFMEMYNIHYMHNIKYYISPPSAVFDKCEYVRQDVPLSLSWAEACQTHNRSLVKNLDKKMQLPLVAFRAEIL